MVWTTAVFQSALVASISIATNAQDLSLVVDHTVAGTFLELALERFESRTGTPASVNGGVSTIEQVQLVRVPKAGSSQASEIARRLAGCFPRGSCCHFPGDPPGSCPAQGLMCPEVIGCVGHSMNPSRMEQLRDPAIFSMSNLRDPVDRMISGIFYTKPHSPDCARDPSVDLGTCFETMTEAVDFQNVAARMMAGHRSYAGQPICMEGCDNSLSEVLSGACSLNYVTMCETWQSSVLLLFETLPWMEPSPDFFPLPAEDGKGYTISRKQSSAEHDAQIALITPEMRERARLANPVDEALYLFVTAKFCLRLRDAGLLHHPLVEAELAQHQPTYARCNDEAWVANTLARFAPQTPEKCRLYEPFQRP